MLANPSGQVMDQPGKPRRGPFSSSGDPALDLPGGWDQPSLSIGSPLSVCDQPRTSLNPPTNAPYSGVTVAQLLQVGRVMEQRLKKAERYRQLANRCADRAKAAELDYMSDFFRKVAVRYVLMAEDLERADLSVYINDRADVFLRASEGPRLERRGLPENPRLLPKPASTKTSPTGLASSRV
jgi:hypothetical protein